MKCISIKLYTPCTTCGTVLPVNGLISELACPKCFTPRKIEPAVWKDILSKSINEGMNLPQDRPETFTWKTGKLSRIMSYHLEFASSLPKKNGDVIVDPDEVVTHAKSGYYIHPASNDKISIREFPVEFSDVMPHGKKIKHSARKLYEIFILGEDFSQISRPESGAVMFDASDTLQALKCTECGSSLDVSNDNKNTRCAHCGTFYYIPSPIWQRLYPDKEIIRWFFLVN